MSELVVRIASRGEGVTTAGRHVPLSAPGDRVTPEGGIIPGPHHQVPPCRHYPQCGGCQLQHVDDAAYADFLVDRIVAALAAQSVSGVEVRPAYLSPRNSRRRATLHWSSRRGGVEIGFKAARSHDIVDMHENHILAPEVVALVAPLRSFLRGRGKAGQAAMTLVDQGIDLTITGAAFEGPQDADALTAFAREHSLGRVSVDEGFGPEARWEPEAVTITLGGVAVAFSPGAFLQATADGERALIAAIDKAIGPAALVADLFAGLGTFALSQGGRVHAAEGSRDAVVALQSAANRGGRAIAVEHRDLFRRPLTGAELARFDAVILDPPRAGAREQVTELARSAVPRIAYVSCNPSTFARDAKTLLDGGWRLEWIKPVGQFRWSTHVELVAAFAR